MGFYGIYHLVSVYISVEITYKEPLSIAKYKSLPDGTSIYLESYMLLVLCTVDGFEFLHHQKNG